MTKLSDTQRLILSQASQRDDRLALPPDRLPAAARQTVAKALLKQGLVSDEHASAANGGGAWQIDGQFHLLRITDAGLRAIGVEPDTDSSSQATPILPAATDIPALPVAGQGDSHAALEPTSPSPSGDASEAAQRPPMSQRGGIARAAALRTAAYAIMAAWEAPEREGLDDAVAALRATLAAPPRAQRSAAAPRQPRSGTKQEAVLALLQRDEGVTIARVMESTGWQQHTVRGFLAGLKRKGVTVEVLERVRQLGPNKQGAKGSYSIYRIVAAAPAEAC